MQHHLKLIYNEYIGTFYRLNRRGQWRKFWTMGNTGIALEIAQYLKKLGIKIKLEEQLTGDLDG